MTPTWNTVLLRPHRLIRPCLLVLAVALIVPDAAHSADDGFTPLFNGQDLSNWRRYLYSKTNPSPNLDGNWSVVNGEIRCLGEASGYIMTENEFSNYTLKVKWRYPADITTKVRRPNSGVLIHATGNDWIWPSSIECQLANQQAGDIYLNPDKNKQYPKLEVEPSRHDPKSERHFFKLGPKDQSFEKPLGEWNEIEITTRDGDITIKVNGQLANEAKNGSLKRGRIAMQSEGAEIHFKDILIRVAR